MPGKTARADDEALLVKLLREGEESAFEELVRSHAGRIFATARRYLPDGEDSQEIVQETFLSAFRSMKGFSGQSLLSTWLTRIAINACLMRLRSRQRKPEEPIDDLLPKFEQDGHRRSGIVEWALPSDAFQSGEIKALVRRSIDELPTSYRTVLLLRDIEEMSTEEAARILEISPNAVKIRLHRARQALRELLSPHFVEDSA